MSADTLFETPRETHGLYTGLGKALESEHAKPIPGIDGKYMASESVDGRFGYVILELPLDARGHVELSPDPAVETQRRVFVLDRRYDRVQILESTGMGGLKMNRNAKYFARMHYEQNDGCGYPSYFAEWHAHAVGGQVAVSRPTPDTDRLVGELADFLGMRKTEVSGSE